MMVREEVKWAKDGNVSEGVFQIFIREEDKPEQPCWAGAGWRRWVRATQSSLQEQRKDAPWPMASGLMLVMDANSWGKVVGGSMGPLCLSHPQTGRVGSKDCCLFISTPFLIFGLVFL